MISLTENTMPIIRELIADPESLGCCVVKLACGATIIDMGLKVKGSWKAGLLLTRATLGDLAIVTLGNFKLNENYSFSSVEVFLEQPKLACVASQLAGWKITSGDGAYSAIGSGPARTQAALPEDQYIQATSYRDPYHGAAILCVQGTAYPTDEIALMVAQKCGVSPEDVYLLISANASVASSMQVSARVIEQTSHLMMSQGMDVDTIVMGRGRAPIAPVVNNETKMMGRINDALIYGSEAEYWVDAEDAQIERVMAHLVGKLAHPCYGELFEESFRKANYHFYEMEESINTVAKVQIHNVNTGRAFCAGEINYEVLARSFLM